MSQHPSFCYKDFHFKKALYQALFYALMLHYVFQLIVILFCVIQLIVICWVSQHPSFCNKDFHFKRALCQTLFCSERFTLCHSANRHFAECHSTLSFCNKDFHFKKSLCQTLFCYFVLFSQSSFCWVSRTLHFATRIFISKRHSTKLCFAQSFCFVSFS